MSFRRTVVVSVVLWLLAPTLAASAVQRAVAINDQRIYREARVRSKAVARVTIGEELNVTGREGALLQLSLPDNRSGWTLANGVVVLDDNIHAAALLFDAAESMAQQDSADDWQAAARLFRRAASLCSGTGLQPVLPVKPSSTRSQAEGLCHPGPYAAEASFRAAELAWRLEIRQTGTMSDKGAGAALAAVISKYPQTQPAARAAFLLLRNSLCEYWDGTPGCPEAEIGLISKYLEQYPESEAATEARYSIAYRHAALVEIYLEKGKPQFNPEKAVEHKAQAQAATEALLQKHAGSVWAARAERLLWSIQNNVGVYSGIEVALKRF